MLARLGSSPSGAIRTPGTVLLCNPDTEHKARLSSQVSGKLRLQSREATTSHKPAKCTEICGQLHSRDGGILKVQWNNSTGTFNNSTPKFMASIAAETINQNNSKGCICWILSAYQRRWPVWVFGSKIAKRGRLSMNE